MMTRREFALGSAALAGWTAMGDGGSSALEATKKWFVEAQYGMMVHWGLYALLAGDVEFYNLTLQPEKSVTWGVFEDLRSGKKFISFATHLWWKYNGDESHALRELNVRLILDTIARQKAKWGDLPVIGGGDLNCNAEGQPALRFFERAGYSDAGKCADETSSVPSEHSSPKRGADGRYHGEKGAVGKKGHAMLDRVFYTKGIHAYRHEVICDQATLDISDHSPVVVDLNFSR